MYKLLLLDIDGTLQDECGKVPQSAKKAIQLCQNNMCQVIVCTGRSIGTISKEILSIGVDGYIAGGGSYIEYQQQVLEDCYFEAQQIDRTIDYLLQQCVPFTIESQNKVYMNQKACDILQRMNEEKGKKNSMYQPLIDEKIIYEDNLSQYHQQNIHKICLWSNETVYEKIKKEWLETMELAQFERLVEYNYYEIIQIGYNKGDAIRKIQALLNISANETICFGDGLNDMTMFQVSTTSIAMKESHPDLKKIASSVCEGVLEDGIYKELKRRKII